MAQSKSKLPENPAQLLPKGRNDWEKQLIRVLSDYLAVNSQAVNGLATGRISNRFNATTAVPTSGQYALGDIVPRADPSLVSAGVHYLHVGWVCVSDGSASGASFADYIISTNSAVATTIPPILELSGTASGTSLTALALQNLNYYASQFGDFIILEDVIAVPPDTSDFLALQNGTLYFTELGQMIELEDGLALDIFGLQNGNTYITETGGNTIGME